MNLGLTNREFLEFEELLVKANTQQLGLMIRSIKNESNRRFEVNDDTEE